MTLTGAEAEPSLRNMSLAALQTLSKAAKAKSAHGFFLMIEGSRIDMAEHTNDPIGTLYDVLAYQETVRTVKTWVDGACSFFRRRGRLARLNRPADRGEQGWLAHSHDQRVRPRDRVRLLLSLVLLGPTLTSCRSGLALGRQLTSAYPEYAWFPEVLHNASNTAEFLSKKISEHDGPVDRDFIVHDILHHGYGIEDASDHEIDQLVSKRGNHEYILSDIISRRAQVGWSTHGHSGVDVNLYAYGEDSEKLMGSHENTEIHDFIKEVMLLDSSAEKDLLRCVPSL